VEVSRLSAVRKLGVLRANGLGDLVFALPALDALRAAYPHAEVVLLGRRWHAELFHGRPGPVDRVIELPPVLGVSASDDGDAPSRPPASVLSSLRKEGFDLALQMHGGGRHSNPFVRELGARVTAGLRTPDAEALDRWVPYILYQPEVMRYLEVAGLVGAPPVGYRPRLAVTDRDVAEAAGVEELDGGLVAFHVGATDPRRRWPAERFARVADELVDRGWRVAFAGTAGEAPLVARALERMRHRARDLTGRLSVGGLAGLLSRCALLIGNDSGPLHLAEAVGTRTVGVYWLPNLVTAAALTRSDHRPCVAWRADCPVCGVRNIDVRCPHDDCFVTEVGVEEVVEQSLDLLEKVER
jgi:ADP-heptose:LPS heptosyltransferase